MTARVRPWLTRDDWREGVIDCAGSTFAFDHVPFLLGRNLDGILRVSYAAVGQDSSVMLGCFPGTHDRDDKLHWRAVHPVLLDHVRRESDVAVIDVNFAVPADRPPTSGGILPFTWELSVLKGFPHGTRIVSFQVPVFGVEAEALVQETGTARRAKRDVRKALSVFDE